MKTFQRTMVLGAAFLIFACALVNCSAANDGVPVVTYYAGPPATTVYYAPAPTVVYSPVKVCPQPVAVYRPVTVYSVPAPIVYQPPQATVVYRPGPLGLVYRPRLHYTPGAYFAPTPTIAFPTVGVISAGP